MDNHTADYFTGIEKRLHIIELWKLTRGRCNLLFFLPLFPWIFLVKSWSLVWAHCWGMCRSRKPVVLCTVHPRTHYSSWLIRWYRGLWHPRAHKNWAATWLEIKIPRVPLGALGHMLKHSHTQQLLAHILSLNKRLIELMFTSIFIMCSPSAKWWYKTQNKPPYLCW